MYNVLFSRINMTIMNEIENLNRLNFSIEYKINYSLFQCYAC